MTEVMVTMVESTVNIRYNNFLASIGMSMNSFVKFENERQFIKQEVTGEFWDLDYEQRFVNELANKVHISMETNKFLSGSLNDYKKAIDILLTEIFDKTRLSRIF